MAGSQAADREGRIIILGAPGHHGANMKPIISIAVHDWHAPVSSELATHALDALEAGSVLRLPLPFTLSADEQSLLSPELLSGARKNISYNPTNARLQGDRKSTRLNSSH